MYHLKVVPKKITPKIDHPDISLTWSKKFLTTNQLSLWPLVHFKQDVQIATEISPVGKIVWMADSQGLKTPQETL